MSDINKPSDIDLKSVSDEYSWRDIGQIAASFAILIIVCVAIIGGFHHAWMMVMR